MKYYSTRDPQKKGFDSAVVIKEGIAADGGLYIPESIPTLSLADIQALCPLSYAERAAKILSLYLTDYTYDELLEDCKAAYSEKSFVGGAAPLHELGDGTYTLELWHGPTAAFKDMALQIMPRLLSRALVKTGETKEALILVATSGDTGKAALEGYKDVDRVKIFVFYPENGVSRVQKLQMQTQEGKNVGVCAIEGNFDDAQTGVKTIFADESIAEKLSGMGYRLSSANSINWGRLAPQIVYYISAYCDLLNAGKISMGDAINVTVPTGNFGNIFAAYLAKRMGLPIFRLVCASNRNNILTDFLATGTYDRNRAFHLTMSPSMDILISSNLERLLSLTAGAERTTAYMDSLKKTGKYTVDADVKAAISRDFFGFFADEKETAATIRDTWREKNYLIDTHTAVGVCCAAKYRKKAKDTLPMVVASTASPFKFAADVYQAVTDKKADSALGALNALCETTDTEIPYPLRGIGSRQVRFSDVCRKEEMWQAVEKFLG